MPCQLCKAEQRTPWFGYNDVCWVAMCSQCNVPMVVLWDHRTVVSSAEADRMIESLSLAARKFFRGPWYIDSKMRAIPTHAHMHARPL